MDSSTAQSAHTDNPPRAIAIIRRRIDTLLLSAVLVLVVLLRLPGFVLPLERDEGAYAYVAWDWLHGGLPYRDAFDHKPPLIYVLYMPALLISQPLTAWMLRLWSTVLFLIAVGLVYLIGRHVWRRPTALLAALLFGCAGSAFGLQGLILNTDQALVLPALLMLWSAIRLGEAEQRRFAVVAGAALAATMLIKPVAVVLVPCLMLSVVTISRGEARRLFAMGAAVALGATLVALPVAGYFALRGGWHDLVFAVWTYNLLYAQESQDRWQLGALVDMFAPFVPLLLVALGGVALLSDRMALAQPTRARRSGWLVVAWTMALFVAALGSLRPFVHYYYPLLPGLALLAAPCLRWLWTRNSATSAAQRSIYGAATLGLAALLLGPFIIQNLRLIGTSAEQQTERLYGDIGKFYFAPAPQVAAYIRAQTQPDDYVYVFAAEPELYLFAERRSSSRYIYDYPFEHVPGARAELLRDLAARPPSMIVTYYGVRPDGFFETVRAQNLSKQAEIGGYEIFGPAQAPAQP